MIRLLLLQTSDAAVAFMIRQKQAGPLLSSHIGMYPESCLSVSVSPVKAQSVHVESPGCLCAKDGVRCVSAGSAGWTGEARGTNTHMDVHIYIPLFSINHSKAKTKHHLFFDM